MHALAIPRKIRVEGRIQVYVSYNVGSCFHDFYAYVSYVIFAMVMWEYVFISAIKMYQSSEIANFFFDSERCGVDFPTNGNVSFISFYSAIPMGEYHDPVCFSKCMTL